MVADREVRQLARPAQLLITGPTREGLKLARELHDVEPQLRLLVTTAREYSPTVSWLPRTHHAFLAKPYALSELLKAARNLLDA